MTKRRFAAPAAMLLGLALAIALVPGGAAAKANSRSHEAAIVAAAHQAFNKFLSSHATMMKANTQLASNSATETGSYNWSGFADVEGGSTTTNGVSGTWTIPSVDCLHGTYANQDLFLAQWVGIDGWSDGTVEQLGTATQCYEDQEFYYDWYEMFPNGTVEEGTQNCINLNTDCPQPGDLISASVDVTPAGAGNNNYRLSLTDFSRPRESFSVTAPCATDVCQDSSAEWIIERPAFGLPFGFQILPLADFDKTAFLSGTVNSGGHTTTTGNFADGTVYDIAMVDDSASYFLDCVDQAGPSGQLLLLSSATACPDASPDRFGGFKATWDSSF